MPEHKILVTVLTNEHGNADDARANVESILHKGLEDPDSEQIHIGFNIENVEILKGERNEKTIS